MDTDRLKALFREESQAHLGRLSALPAHGEAVDLAVELALSLKKLLERSSGVETTAAAVEEELGRVIEPLRRLQREKGLEPLEMVFLLLTLRDAFRRAVEESQEASAKAAGEQVGRLLSRLSVVFFENSFRFREPMFPSQDVLAIEYALLYERTRQFAVQDALTGLANFGYFLERLREEKNRAERYQRLLSLVLFDIDHFKKYNDTHGHPAGNAVLKKIAALIQEEAREVDLAARFGGEELALILPETHRFAALEAAERIRRRVENENFPGGESQPLGKITISAGVATFPVDAENEEKLIQRADEALYLSKRAGRNRVTAYQPPDHYLFRFRPPRPSQTVALVGNFNNWDPAVDLMQPQADGVFTFDMALNPGVYRYKYVLDGVEWVADPNAPLQPDHFGGQNNVLVFDPNNG